MDFEKKYQKDHGMNRVKNHLESLPDCQNAFCSWCELYIMYIVVEVTLNRPENGSQRSDQPEIVNFEPIIRGLKGDVFD